MTRVLRLVINLADGVDPDDVATDVNAAILCSLEEDAKAVTGWEWVYPEADETD